MGCIFSENETQADGGAIGLKGSRVYIANCTFAGNDAGTDGYGRGGAISVNDYNANFNIVEDCEFSQNTATGSGGAIHWLGDHFTIRRCTFNHNSASSTDYGGGIYASPHGTGEGTIADCEFIDNSAGQGGGLYVGSATFDIHNCVFYSNHAATQGGGIYSYGGTADVTNCTIHQNYAYTEGGYPRRVHDREHHQQHHMDQQVLCRIPLSSRKGHHGIRRRHLH
ncbi:MAG: hypothetical protein JRJ83_13180 [Deltaproteobacteria bacterium]|nr:hypothetical protein [Deltaproteobacteria bacterium]